MRAWRTPELGASAPPQAASAASPSDSAEGDAGGQVAGDLVSGLGSLECRGGLLDVPRTQRQGCLCQCDLAAGAPWSLAVSRAVAGLDPLAGVTGVLGAEHGLDERELHGPHAEGRRAVRHLGLEPGLHFPQSAEVARREGAMGVVDDRLAREALQHPHQREARHREHHTHDGCDQEQPPRAALGPHRTEGRLELVLLVGRLGLVLGLDRIRSGPDRVLLDHLDGLAPRPRGGLGGLGHVLAPGHHDQVLVLVLEEVVVESVVVGARATGPAPRHAHAALIGLQVEGLAQRIGACLPVVQRPLDRLEALTGAGAPDDLHDARVFGVVPGR